MTNLDSILRSRDITLLTKVHRVKVIAFPVVMYGCESWTIKKAEHQRIDAFKLWCWTRLLRVPLTARRANQSILKEINSDYSLKGLMLSWNSNILVSWCEDWFIREDFDAGKDRRQEEKGTTEDTMIDCHLWLNVCELEQAPRDGEGQGSLSSYSPWSCKESDTTEWLKNNITKTSLKNSERK